MRREDFLKEIGETFVAAAQLLQKKSEDYATDEEPFNNIELASKVAQIEPEKAFAFLISLKAVRLGNIVANGGAANESIEDTLLDLPNYSAMFRVWLRSPDGKDYGQVTSDFLVETPSVTEEKRTLGGRAADFLGGLVGR